MKALADLVLVKYVTTGDEKDSLLVTIADVHTTDVHTLLLTRAKSTLTNQTPTQVGVGKANQQSPSILVTETLCEISNLTHGPSHAKLHRARHTTTRASPQLFRMGMQQDTRDSRTGIIQPTTRMTT